MAVVNWYFFITLQYAIMNTTEKNLINQFKNQVENYHYRFEHDFDDDYEPSDIHPFNWYLTNWYRLSTEYWMRAFLDIEIEGNKVTRYLQAEIWNWQYKPVFKKETTKKVNFNDIIKELEIRGKNWDLFNLACKTTTKL